MPAEVNQEKCEGCQDCIPVCPQNCISMTENDKAVVNQDDCIDCNACVDVCTKSAIDMK